MSVQIQFFEDGTVEMAVGRNNHLAQKRRWENGFQKWSNEKALDGSEPYGRCGYGSMCDWCEDNTYGRPCVRALNSMCRDKGIVIDYNDYNFETIW